MTGRRLCGAATLAALLLPAFGLATAHAATRVSFIAPQTYTDGNLTWGPVDQRLTLEGLERIMLRLADRHVPAGTDLDIEVLDIDLAGKIDPLRSRTGTLRVMRQDTWPQMRLRTTLRRNGRIVAQGEERVLKVNYLMDPIAIRSDDRLRFEKAMLADWFARRFSKRVAAQPAG
ncbi:DUF3016 domain-containing protein [Ancylobacter sp. A5.8]|uniref:DUF3016 domain-containing protein n=1 Tax=Ancylobacter gelatini TaxID=2919920 RepID=UPI001F4E368B|nr:DUF3016 domain-containing protein [Ancylobacter gelatini]MCJ8142649.1 DUF3016 domain-containing protein [Ancylobacter gelatini]